MTERAGSHNAVSCGITHCRLSIPAKRQAIAEFCARQGVGFCPRGSVHRYVTERARFSQRRIARNYALPAANSCEKAGNSGILCETRRGVLRTRERTSVRDQVLRFSQRRIARNYALPTVNSCEKAGNSGILCETRRGVLPARERTSVRDRTGRFSQRRIVRNYTLPA